MSFMNNVMKNMTVGVKINIKLIIETISSLKKKNNIIIVLISIMQKSNLNTYLFFANLLNRF